MSQTIRKRISFSLVDVEEIDKLIEEREDIRNYSEAFQFLLYYFLERQQIDSDKDEILSKLSQMDYQMMLTQYILKELSPEILGVTDTSDLFIKAEQKLKNQLRGLK